MMRAADFHAPSRLLPLPSLSGSFPTCLFRLVLCAAALLFYTCAAGAVELHGRVVGVSDGDTITVLDATRSPHKIRLAGIDAPEKNQPYGARSKENLSALVFGKPVVVVWQKRDRYGRILGHVLVLVPGTCGRPDCARLEDAGLEQVESGLAWHYKRYQNEQTPDERRRYARAEQDARAKREGLWQDTHPVPPWEYRVSQRAGAERRRS